MTEDIARELPEIAHALSSLKGEAGAYLTESRYETLKLRLEFAQAAVEAAAMEARRRARLNESEGR